MFFCLIGLYILSTSNSFLKNIKKVNVFGNKPYPRMERVKMLIEFWITRYKPNLILAVLITSDSGFFTTIHSNHILFIIRTTFIPKIWIPTDQNLSYVSIYLSILWTMILLSTAIPWLTWFPTTWFFITRCFILVQKKFL